MSSTGSPPPVHTGGSLTSSGASDAADGSDPAAPLPDGGGGPPRHPEDRLGLTWRTVASSLVLMVQKAERAAAVTVRDAEGRGPDGASDDAAKTGPRELDEAVLAFLRHRQEWLRLLSHLESKLEGRAKETEVLQNYHATMPRLSSRKRTRDAAPPSDAEPGDSSVHVTEG